MHVLLLFLVIVLLLCLLPPKSKIKSTKRMTSEGALTAGGHKVPLFIRNGMKRTYSARSAPERISTVFARMSTKGDGLFPRGASVTANVCCRRARSSLRPAR
jgi:hypothetical protein